jgi:sulfate adenylyltransferase
VAGFHSGEPLHRAGHEFIMRAVRESEANVFLHPVVGGVTAGGIDDYTLVRCFKAAQQHFPPHVAQLAVLPLAPRMAGRREAVWQAIVRKNFGCSLLITKSAPPEAEGNSRQPPSGFEEELGVTILEDGPDAAALSSAEVRNLLEGGDVLPGGFAFPEVEAELRRSCPPRGRQGFTVFFTGLSGSGKSTVANALRARLLEIGGRQVTLLDGDLVRKNLSSELSFSKEHREINIQRIGFVASEITRNGGVAICAPIAPYRSTRRKVRELIEARGGFILVHVATPVEVCEARDRKGLYAKARAGLIKEFTGISDPYEEPAAAEIVIDTREFTPDEASQHILSHLEREGYLGGDPG